MPFIIQEMKFKEIMSKNTVTEKGLTELIVSRGGVTRPYSTIWTLWSIFIKVPHLKPAFKIVS